MSLLIILSLIGPAAIVIIVVIVALQIISFVITLRRRIRFKEIYPETPSESLSVYVDKETRTVQIGKKNPDSNKVFDEIVSAINNYLKKNRGATDFSILKDIADRNSDSLESQIEATAPIPTYLGLLGTLAGIILGVSKLGFKGGITELMTYAGEVENTSAAGAEGIETLLAGVGVAMITTLFGVLLSVIGSWFSKEVYKEGEHRKHLFLNWLQGELLPQMNSSMVSTLDILQRNLNGFNESFAENSKKLEGVFAGINTSYKDQAQLVRQIQSLKVSEIATANIKVLQELQKCTDEINNLQSFLRQSGQYLSKVDSLNSNLKDQYDRTLLIEEMAAFFKKELVQVESRQAALSNVVARIDQQMKGAADELKTHIKKQSGELINLVAESQHYYKNAIKEQQKSLDVQLAKTPAIAEELKNLTAVKENIGKLVAKTEYQNTRTDELINANKKIAEVCSNLVGKFEMQSKQTDQLISANSKIVSVCTEQNSLLQNLRRSFESNAQSGGRVMYGQVLQDPHQKHRIRIPLFYGIVVSATCLVLVGTCAFFIVKSLL